jgi:hypothetical protein
MIRSILDWEPSTPLQVGLEKTYTWIEGQYAERKAGRRTPASDSPVFEVPA